MKRPFLVALLLAAGLAGCVTTPDPAAPPVTPQPELQFVDLPSFDRSLTASLAAPMPRVEVAFYDRVTPSALPDRLQNWLAAVEKEGGKVRVVPPPPPPGTRSVMLIASAISSLWSASKMARELALQQQFKTARLYDAELRLKTDANGQTVVDKVVFVQRP